MQIFKGVASGKQSFRKHCATKWFLEANPRNISASKISRYTVYKSSFLWSLLSPSFKVEKNEIQPTSCMHDTDLCNSLVKETLIDGQTELLYQEDTMKELRTSHMTRWKSSHSA